MMTRDCICQKYKHMQGTASQVVCKRSCMLGGCSEPLFTFQASHDHDHLYSPENCSSCIRGCTIEEQNEQSDLQHSPALHTVQALQDSSGVGGQKDIHPVQNLSKDPKVSSSAGLLLCQALGEALNAAVDYLEDVNNEDEPSSAAAKPASIYKPAQVSCTCCFVCLLLAALMSACACCPVLAFSPTSITNSSVPKLQCAADFELRSLLGPPVMTT